MSHYVIPGGAYAQAFAALKATGWRLNLQSTPRPGAAPKKPEDSKTPFTCRFCDGNHWSKPDRELICASCILAAAPPELHEVLHAFVVPKRGAATELPAAQSYDQPAE